MIVSQFRVQNRASTKQAPRIYGFYLTNLGDKFYSFRVTLYAESQAPLNQFFRLDYGEWGDDLWSDVPGIYTGGYMLGAARHETVLVRLVPIAGAADADISGHVELSIPVVGEIVNYKWLITKTVRQGEKPVPVLVHAFETSAPNDQGRSITLASGQALNEIAPDEVIYLDTWGLTLTLASAEASSSSSEARRRDDAAYFESRSAQAAVFSYLAHAGQNPDYLAAINKQLEADGHPVKIVSTKTRRQPARE